MDSFVEEREEEEEEGLLIMDTTDDHDDQEEDLVLEEDHEGDNVGSGSSQSENDTSNLVASSLGLQADTSDIFDEIIRREESDDMSLVLSGASIELAQSSKQAAKTVQKKKTNKEFACSTCNSTFGSKSRLENHMFKHILESAKARRLSDSDLTSYVEEAMVKALEEIQREPNNGKKHFAENILRVINERPNDWYNFLATIAVPILDCVSVSTKIIPCNQYEDSLIALNKILNNNQEVDELVDGLLFLNDDNCLEEGSPIPKMVLFQLLSKVLNSLSIVLFNSMKLPTEEVVVDCLQPIEVQSLEFHLSKLFQAYYVKGVNSQSSRWLAFCACFRNKFIDIVNNSSVEVSLDVNVLCKNQFWEKNQSDIYISLKPDVVNFFVHVEGIIRSTLKNVSSDVSAPTIYENIVKAEDINTLQLWYSLTGDFFSEEVDSLMFMKELINIYLKLSLRLKRLTVKALEIDKNQGVSKGQHSLRDDLKRN